MPFDWLDAPFSFSCSPNEEEEEEPAVGGMAARIIRIKKREPRSDKFQAHR